MTLKPFSRGLACGLAAVPLNFGAFTAAAARDDVVRCESYDHRHRSCPISVGKHGYVRLKRQLGRAPCIQGRSWNYGKHEIWVDDNCRAEFYVEDRDGGGSSGKTAAAIAVLGALAIGAAVAASKKEKEKEEAQAYSSRSAIEPWMVGSFRGFNPRYNASVDLDVDRDGRVTAFARGENMKGYINDYRLFVGDYEFYLTRVDDGFETRQVGDTDNRVVYRRR